jgi:hypothetical protein
MFKIEIDVKGFDDFQKRLNSAVEQLKELKSISFPIEADQEGIYR